MAGRSVPFSLGGHRVLPRKHARAAQSWFTQRSRRHVLTPPRLQGATWESVVREASRAGLALVYQDTEAILACGSEAPALKVGP